MLIKAQSRFARRRAEAVVRQLRFMRDRIEPRGALFVQAREEDLWFAIRDLPGVIDAARRQRRIPLTDDGTYAAHWFGPMLNLLGDIYGTLPHIYRDQFLRCVVSFLDSAGQDSAKEHVRLIRNPLLIGDIILNRHAYFPSLDDVTLRLARCPDGAALWRVRSEKINDFWTCLGVTLNGAWITESARRWYYDAFPQLLDQTLDFVAALTQDLAADHAKNAGIKLALAIEDTLILKFDPRLHQRIRDRIGLRRWIKL